MWDAMHAKLMFIGLALHWCAQDGHGCTPFLACATRGNCRMVPLRANFGSADSCLVSSNFW